MNHIPKLCALSLMAATTFAALAAFAHDPKERDPQTPAQQHDMSAMEKNKTDHANMAATEAPLSTLNGVSHSDASYDLGRHEPARVALLNEH